MEAGKSRRDEVIKEIDKRREQCKAKQIARLEKIRAINLQKYNKENPNKSVFVNDKSFSMQSQPKNFNSMTDIRQNTTRKSIMTTTLQSVPLRINIGAAGPSTANKSGHIRARQSFISQRRCIAVTDPSILNKSGQNESRKSIVPKIKYAAVAGPSTAGKSEHKTKKTIIPQRKGLAVAGPSIANKSTHNQVRKSIIPQIKSISLAAGDEIMRFSTMSTITSSKLYAFKPEIKKPPVSKYLNTTIIPKPPQDRTKGMDKTYKLSVFERLYQPKRLASHRKEDLSEHKSRSFVSHKRKVLAPIDAAKNVAAMRRSISAVHFKRIGKHELSNCFHRFSSVKDLNQIDLSDRDPKPEIINSIKSEKRKVKFLTATPRVEELQSKLNNWLESRGKSLSTYPHLRCFGLHRPIGFKHYDEENKENISADISDDGSFNELMNEESPVKDDCKTKWRRASLNDSELLSELSKSISQSPASMETPMPKPKVDQLLLCALTDLSQLIREGYDWEQCARWLRCMRSRWPHAPALAAYWECRAALEECRGDLPKSLHCWEEAIAKGTQSSVVEASLDQLLDKFMQLNISPSADGNDLARSYHMSAKSVLKSTLIRFAVRNIKAKETSAAYTVTPVRRSHRLSVAHPGGDAPAHNSPIVQVATSLRHIDRHIRDNAVFVPNKLLQDTP